MLDCSCGIYTYYMLPTEFRTDGFRAKCSDATHAMVKRKISPVKDSVSTYDCIVTVGDKSQMKFFLLMKAACHLGYPNECVFGILLVK